MQIFEVLELEESPYMATNEILEGETVKDFINENNAHKVFLLVDHDAKNIYLWNGPRSPFKLQIYGGILARKMRQQLRLFYRVYPLNIFSEDDKKFKDVMEKSLGGGTAKPIQAEDFVESRYSSSSRLDITIATNINVNKAIEYINEIPLSEKYERKFLIVGGNVYTEEEVTESFLTEEKTIKKPLKLGFLNRGFTFFSDQDYSTRLVINDRQIQGIELVIRKLDKAQTPPLESKIPIFEEEKYSKPGNIHDVLNAFKIPDTIPEEEKD
ncbi:MAG: hypothetical protein EU532_08145 [Promethearchaeota archaeon]|nr:MAG: hypothetical protein EU532_08145 [Candidatus Lokiarchaeota archaeon]